MYDEMSCNSTYRLRYWNLVPQRHAVMIIDFCCNSTYRLRYWNTRTQTLWIRRNCVATAPTVYGIETHWSSYSNRFTVFELQQHLPFTVLKPWDNSKIVSAWLLRCNSTYRLRYWNATSFWISYNPDLIVATAPTVYGIETMSYCTPYQYNFFVATAPTVYGIETVSLFVA